jgi:hypothetical protein
MQRTLRAPHLAAAARTNAMKRDVVTGVLLVRAPLLTSVGLKYRFVGHGDRTHRQRFQPVYCRVR